MASSTGRTSCCTPSCESIKRVLRSCLCPCAVRCRTLPPSLPLCRGLPRLLPRWPCSNQYIEDLGKLEGVKDNMVGGGLPVELAVELLRWAVAPGLLAARLRPLVCGVLSGQTVYGCHDLILNTTHGQESCSVGASGRAGEGPVPPAGHSHLAAGWAHQQPLSSPGHPSSWRRCHAYVPPAVAMLGRAHRYSPPPAPCRAVDEGTNPDTFTVQVFRDSLAQNQARCG